MSDDFYNPFFAQEASKKEVDSFYQSVNPQQPSYFANEQEIEDDSYSDTGFFDALKAGIAVYGTQNFISQEIENAFFIPKVQGGKTLSSQEAKDIYGLDVDRDINEGEASYLSERKKWIEEKQRVLSEGHEGIWWHKDIALAVLSTAPLIGAEFVAYATGAKILKGAYHGAKIFKNAKSINKILKVTDKASKAINATEKRKALANALVKGTAINVGHEAYIWDAEKHKGVPYNPLLPLVIGAFLPLAFYGVGRRIAKSKARKASLLEDASKNDVDVDETVFNFKDTDGLETRDIDTVTKVGSDEDSYTALTSFKKENPNSALSTVDEETITKSLSLSSKNATEAKNVLKDLDEVIEETGFRKLSLAPTLYDNIIKLMNKADNKGGFLDLSTLRKSLEPESIVEKLRAIGDDASAKVIKAINDLNKGTFSYIDNFRFKIYKVKLDDELARKVINTADYEAKLKRQSEILLMEEVDNFVANHPQGLDILKDVKAIGLKDTELKSPEQYKVEETEYKKYDKVDTDTKSQSTVIEEKFGTKTEQDDFTSVLDDIDTKTRNTEPSVRPIKTPEQRVNRAKEIAKNVHEYIANRYGDNAQNFSQKKYRDLLKEELKEGFEGRVYTNDELDSYLMERGIDPDNIKWDDILAISKDEYVINRRSRVKRNVIKAGVLEKHEWEEFKDLISDVVFCGIKGRNI